MTDLEELTEEEWWEQVIAPSCERFLDMTGDEFMQLTDEERMQINKERHCDFVKVDMLTNGYRKWWKENRSGDV